MGARRKGREYALQALYLLDVSKMPAEKAISTVLYGQKVEAPIAQFSRELAIGASEHMQEIDLLVQEHTKNWEMSRMAALDRNILRLGAYELLYESDTPISVIIDEAVEMAKEFSTPESGKFVNGILDKLKKVRPHGKDNVSKS
ncbi:MAG: transcription antitermination factor NusB [Elusimicrobiota bacterium]